jgi:hypothetical protein
MADGGTTTPPKGFFAGINEREAAQLLSLAANSLQGDQLWHSGLFVDRRR